MKKHRMAALGTDLTKPGALTMDKTDARDGVIAGLLAYTLWGLFPIYFKLVESVLPTEVLVHRILWAVPFGGVIIHFRRQWREVRRALPDRTTLAWLSIAAVAMTLNWLIYIWAIQNERIFESSIGYYMNPMMFVLVGVVMFGERLRRLQMVAVVLATVGVAVLTLSAGAFPWVAISLATLFTLYGVIRRQVAIGAMPGLFIETLLLLPFAAAWLTWLLISGNAAFGYAGLSMSGLLVLAGPITVMPLLLFAISAKQLSLTTIGFMQFLAPTLQFIVGVFYGEQLTTAHLICFGCIWTAVIFFSIDAVKSQKKPLQAKPAGA